MSHLFLKWRNNIPALLHLQVENSFPISFVEERTRKRIPLLYLATEYCGFNHYTAQHHVQHANMFRPREERTSSEVEFFIYAFHMRLAIEKSIAPFKNELIKEFKYQSNWAAQTSNLGILLRIYSLFPPGIFAMDYYLAIATQDSKLLSKIAKDNPDKFKNSLQKEASDKREQIVNLLDPQVVDPKRFFAAKRMLQTNQPPSQPIAEAERKFNAAERIQHLSSFIQLVQNYILEQESQPFTTNNPASGLQNFSLLKDKTESKSDNVALLASILKQLTPDLKEQGVHAIENELIHFLNKYKDDLYREPSKDKLDNFLKFLHFEGRPLELQRNRMFQQGQLDYFIDHLVKKPSPQANISL